jgi:putative ABC transport system permease protein
MRDLRFAFRSLRKQPGFTAIAVLTIALGVGANSAIFSVVDAVMLRPLPFLEANRVVVINEHTPQFPTLSLSAENFRDVCAQARSFQACGAFRNTTFNLSGRGEPQRIAAKMLTANLLPLLGIPPALGRSFSAREDAAGGPAVALLSDGLWHARFGSDLAILGTRVLLDGEPYAVVGVLPPGFRLFQSADVFVPIGPFLAAQPADRSWHPGILPMARLASGVSLQQANTEIAGIAQRLERV